MSTEKLPDGWTRVKFGDIAASITERVDDPSAAGVERYVGLEHLDSDSTAIRRWGSPRDVEATKLRFCPGDVIYARRRAYQRKLGVADFDGICSAHALVLRAKPAVCLPEFLPYFLQGDAFHQRALDISVGSLSPTINWKTLRVQEFVLPSLHEQQQIVDFLSAVDAHVSCLAKQAEAALTTRSAVLSEFFSDGGDGWTETTLGEVAEVILGRQLSPSKKLGRRPRKYLRAANIGSWGISLDDVLQMDFTEDEEAHFASRVGDVLMVEGGNEKSVGCPALVGEQEEGLCIQNSIVRCRIKDGAQMFPEFLFQLLRHSFWSGKLAEVAAGTTILHLGQQRAQIFPLMLPPPDEQKRIVEIGSSVDDVIQTSRRAIREAKNLRSGLLSVLLAGVADVY